VARADRRLREALEVITDALEAAGSRTEKVTRQPRETAMAMNKEDLLEALGIQRRGIFTDWLAPAAIGFGIGAAVGAAVALLVAPSAGSELRQDLRRAVQRGRERVEEMASERTEPRH
jgi:hypothetical protein